MSFLDINQLGIFTWTCSSPWLSGVLLSMSAHFAAVTLVSVLWASLSDTVGMCFQQKKTSAHRQSQLDHVHTKMKSAQTRYFESRVACCYWTSRVLELNAYQMTCSVFECTPLWCRFGLWVFLMRAYIDGNGFVHAKDTRSEVLNGPWKAPSRHSYNRKYGRRLLVWHAVQSSFAFTVHADRYFFILCELCLETEEGKTLFAKVPWYVWSVECEWIIE